MDNMQREYLILFNAVTDAERELQLVKAKLMEAQQRAEELFIERDTEHEEEKMQEK